METAALRYEILKNIDSVAFSAKHAANIELVLRECLEITRDVTICMNYDYVDKVVNSLNKKSLIIPIKSDKGWQHRVNLPLLLYSIKYNKDFYSELIRALTSIISNRIIGMLVSILPQSMFHRRNYVYLMVASTLSVVSYPHLTIPNLKSVLYVDDKVKYSTDDLSLLQRYFDDNSNVETFWLSYLVEWVLQRRFSENVLSLKMKKAFVSEIARTIDVYLKNSISCKRPPGFQFLIDIVFGLTSVPYIYKLWPQVTQVFESFTGFCVERITKG